MRALLLLRVQQTAEVMQEVKEAIRDMVFAGELRFLLHDGRRLLEALGVSAVRNWPLTGCELGKGWRLGRTEALGPAHGCAGPHRVFAVRPFFYRSTDCFSMSLSSLLSAPRLWILTITKIRNSTPNQAASCQRKGWLTLSSSAMAPT